MARPTASPETLSFVLQRRHTDAPRPSHPETPFGLMLVPGSAGRPRTGSLQMGSVSWKREVSRRIGEQGKGVERRSLPGGLEKSRGKSKSVNRVHSSMGREKYLRPQQSRKPGDRSASEKKSSGKAVSAVGGLKPSACTSHSVDLNLIRQYNEEKQHLQTTINDLLSGRILLPGILRSHITDFAPWTAEAQKGVRFA